MVAKAKAARGSGRKATARKSPARKASARKTPARKTPARKTPKRKITKGKKKKKKGTKRRFKPVAVVSPMRLPKRPTNAFMLFTTAHRASVQQRVAGGVAEVARELGAMWRELPPPQKGVYEKMAKELGSRHVFLKKVEDAGGGSVGGLRPSELRGLLEHIVAQQTSWGAEEQWVPVTIFFLMLLKSPVSWRKFAKLGGVTLVTNMVSAATTALAGDTSTVSATDAPDLLETGLTVLRSLPLGAAELKGHPALPRETKRLRDLLRAGIQDKVAESSLTRCVQELIDHWSGVMRGETKAPRPPPNSLTGGPPTVEDTQLRAKVVELLVKAFGLPSNAVARGAEEALFDLHGTSVEYRQSARTLSYNVGLPSNTVLRAALADGSITPAELAVMDAQELAPPDMQQKRKETEEQCMRDVVDHSGGQVLVWDKYAGGMRAPKKSQAEWRPSVGAMHMQTPPARPPPEAGSAHAETTPLDHILARLAARSSPEIEHLEPPEFAAPP